MDWESESLRRGAVLGRVEIGRVELCSRDLLWLFSARVDENGYNDRGRCVATAHHGHRIPVRAKWLVPHPQVVFHASHSLISTV